MFEVSSPTVWYRGGLAVLHRISLTKNVAVSTRDFVFTAFEICEVRLSYDGHTAVFLSVYRPPPSRQNKLTNAMFLEQFSDLLESYVSCDRLFVVGDLNVHFDKPSDHSPSVLNVVLNNLSLPQLVNVHRLVGLVVKASASRAEGPGFESRLRRDFFRGRVIPVT